MNSSVRRFAWLLMIVGAGGTVWAEELLAQQTKTAAAAIKPTQADVKYGPAERNVLDFIRPSRVIRPSPGSRLRW